MDELDSYQNFLRSFINEGIFLVDEPQTDQLDQTVPDLSTSVNGEEPSQKESRIIPSGNAAANEIFLLNQACEGWIKPENEARFHKLLQAIKKDIDSVALLNVNSFEAPDIKQWLEESKYEKIIALGAEEYLDKTMERDQFDVFSINKRQYLITPSLDDIFADKNKGLKLWNALKQLFPEANNA